MVKCGHHCKSLVSTEISIFVHLSSCRGGHLPDEITRMHLRIRSRYIYIRTNHVFDIQISHKIIARKTKIIPQLSMCRSKIFVLELGVLQVDRFLMKVDRTLQCHDEDCLCFKTASWCQGCKEFWTKIYVAANTFQYRQPYSPLQSSIERQE